jgi:acetyl esterase/lipase
VKNLALLFLLVFSFTVVGGASGEANAKTYKVREHRNIAYKKSGLLQNLLDVYTPKGKKLKNLPVVMLIHGGMWTYGPGPGFGLNKDTYALLATRIAKRGMVVVVPNYRLRPLHKYPKYIQDVASAFAWTKKNISRYKGSKRKLFVSGHSAGGHLAALLGTNTKYLKAAGCRSKDIRGLIPISGVYFLAKKTAGGAFTKKQFRDASPGKQVQKGKKKPLFPVLLVVASGDYPEMRRDARRLRKVFKNRKVKVSLTTVSKTNHDTIVSSKKLPRLVSGFVKKTLR